jgi:hypothetical protein
VPGLMSIEAAAILHEALQLEIGTRNVDAPKKYRATLEDDINLLAHPGGPLESQKVNLHKVRSRRGDVAHKAASQTNWSDLQADVATIHTALQTLNFVGQRPQVDILAHVALPRANPENSGTMRDLARPRSMD